MKKFLALFFALILALSSLTVAFAAKDDLTCDACYTKLANEKAYEAHINGDCLVLFTSCEYCSAKVATENYNNHVIVCPKAYADCQYCGVEYHKDSLAAHESACAKKPATPDAKDQYTCDICSSIFTDEATYKAHRNSTCLVAYKDCPYCAAKVATDDLDSHQKTCPKGARKCDYCGEDFKNQGEYDLHIEPCKAEYLDIPVAKLLDKVVELVKGINWGELIEKVGGFIKGIDFEGLFGDLKNLVGGIDFEGILGGLEDTLGKIVPAEKK